jgi:hypothetical protein
MCPNGMICDSTSSDNVPPKSDQNHDKTSDQNHDKTSDQNHDKSKNLIKSPHSETNGQYDKVDYSELDSSEADLLRAVIASAR